MKTVSKKWIHTGRTIYTTVTDPRSRHPEQRQAILSIAEGWSDKEAAELCERIVRLPELEELIEVAEALQVAEADYRLAHDIHGDGSLVAGTMWDRMRKAGDQVRTMIEKVKGGEG